MTLAAGTKLGPYEILAPVGAGGMGEVYRAKDTRLDRIVAVKVMPSHLSQNAEVRQRFEREAKTISSLSHPHICALYDVGREGETDYLVMEYLEGETLTDRLAKGSLPLAQLLRFGIEIADALDKAHRRGIVHRDLKPGNVMLTKSGVKLLDFGLAKTFGRSLDATGNEQAAAGQHPMAGNALTAIPTVIGSPNLTQEGTILGTFQYMAPEQLEGKEADARTDIFAFGSVLYEMATGQKAFSGRSQASLIASILEREPPAISTVQLMTPPALDRVVKTCLAKDPEERWQTAHDVMLQLKWIAEGGSQAGLPAPLVARRKSREKLAWGLVVIAFLAALAGAAGTAFFAHRARIASRPMRSSILPPEAWSFASVGSVAVSPDGRQLAFVAVSPERKTLLWVRPLGALSPRPLSDTEGASYPFWSPDSRFIGFFAGGKLKKIEVSGGPAQTICDAPIGRGASWNRHGVIVLAPRNRSPIHRVLASGSSPTPVTRFGTGEGSHRWPYFLPDGRHFLFTVLGGAGQPSGRYRLFVGSLDSNERKELFDVSSNVAYTAPGYLLFVREANLLAQPFDASRREIRGEPVLVGDHVSYSGNFIYADFTASQDGVIAYKNSTLSSSKLLWYDRGGAAIGSVGEPAYYRDPRLSPDGRRIAVFRVDPRTQHGDIWLYESERESATRFTFQPSQYWGQAWSPDGQRIVYSVLSAMNLKTSSNPEVEEQLLQSGGLKRPSDWSPDGRYIVYGNLAGETGWDLFLLALSEDRKPAPFLATPFNELGGRFSPDGRWIAYASDESGRYEVFVRPFPGPGGAVRVSTGGGGSPRWRQDGREIFYMAEDRKLMSAEIKAGLQLEVGKVRPLFEVQVAGDPLLESEYDVTRDGQRFLVNTPMGEKAVSSVTLVLNWTAELKKQR